MNDTIQTFNVSITGNAIIAEYEDIKAKNHHDATAIAVGRFIEKGTKQGWDTKVVSVVSKIVGE